jgi:sirohydrochlorin ferrochelatase
MPAQAPHGIIIVDHGSRRAEANALLDTIAAHYRARTGAAIVEPAHMELAEPSIAQAFDRCVAAGAETVVIALFFLSPGRHSREDIPQLAAEAAARHPGVHWYITPPLGQNPALIDLLHQQVQSALQHPCGE